MDRYEVLTKYIFFLFFIYYSFLGLGLDSCCSLVCCLLVRRMRLEKIFKPVNGRCWPDRAGPWQGIINSSQVNTQTTRERNVSLPLLAPRAASPSPRLLFSSYHESSINNVALLLIACLGGGEPIIARNTRRFPRPLSPRLALSHFASARLGLLLSFALSLVRSSVLRFGIHLCASVPRAEGEALWRGYLQVFAYDFFFSFVLKSF